VPHVISTENAHVFLATITTIFGVN